MKEISLSNGDVAFVDDEDFEPLIRWKWHAKRDIYTTYAKRHIPRTKDGRRHGMTMHRSIMHAPIGVDVDHKNGNGLDNRKENLRLCSHQNNTRNSRLHKNNKSGIAGVSCKIKYGTWRAVIQNKQIGQFKTKEGARVARRLAEIAFYGEFAPTPQLGRIERQEAA